MTEQRTREIKRWKVPKGRVCVQEDLCKGCGFCIDFCPKDVLAAASHYNAKGYHPPELIDPEECIMCRFCELVCPDFSIWTEQPEQEGQEQEEEDQDAG